MKSFARGLRALPLALLLLSLHAADAATASIEPLDRTRISAMNPWQLRREIQRIEGRFFALYNTLSTRHEFDIVCTAERLANSKRKYRSCRPRFLLTAERAEAEAFLDGVLFSGTDTGPAGENQSVSAASLQGGPAGTGQRSGGALLPQSAAQARRAEYRRYMLDIINASPDLMVLVRDREALEAALRKAPADKN